MRSIGGLWRNGRSGRRCGAALAACTALTLMGGLLHGQAHAASQAVSIDNFAFSPGTVTVSIGDTVTWTDNQAGVPHTVTADDGAFDSGRLAPGATFSMTFGMAGTFTYHCNIHPSMHGAVVVTAAGGNPADSGSTPAASASDGTSSGQGGQAGQGMTLFHAGVNLVGVPAGTSLGATAVFELNDAGDGYRQLDPGEALGPAEGYWAFFDQDAFVSLPAGSSAPATVKATAGQFVMIGDPSGRLPATVTGADAVFVFDAVSGTYHTTTTLQPGQGVWAISIHGGTITITPTEPTTPTPTPAPMQNAPIVTQPATNPASVYNQSVMTNLLPVAGGGTGGYTPHYYY